MAGVISCSCLGSFGRFGNQLFQYAVARKFAEKHGAELQTPAWVGQSLFEIDDPPVSRALPRMPIDHLPWGRVDVDLFGYFQFQEAMDDLRVSELRQWFTLRPEWAALRRKPRPYYIAANVRRGDYLHYPNIYAIVTDESYYRACERFGLDADSLIFVGEELRAPNAALDPRGLGFVSDFLTVMDADVILRANSTFSWWAALLSRARVFSPLVEDRTGEQCCEFVAGNWPRMCDRKNTGTNLTDLHVRE